MTNDSADQQLLTDFLLKQCSEQSDAEIRARLQRDENFRRLHDDLKNTFAALSLCPQAPQSDNLVERTMARIRSHRQMDQLIARQETARRVFRPTFQMRELAAAAAVLLMLGTVFVPSVRQARQKSAGGLCASQVGQLGSAMLHYASMNNGVLPAAADLSTRWWPGAGEPATSNSSALFRLVRHGYLHSPVPFQCPSVGGGSFVVKSDMLDFPASRYISYSYQHTLGNGNVISVYDSDMLAVAEQMAILADGSPVTRGAIRGDRIDRMVSPNHGGTGQNVLYLDGHVTFHKLPTVGVHGNNIYLAEGIYKYTGTEAPVSKTDSFLLPAYTGGQ